jgi:hypothetical protein
MSQFGVWAIFCVGKIGIDSSIQAQGAGDFMSQQRRSYGLSDKNESLFSVLKFYP